MEKRFRDFETRIQTASDSAQEALNNFEKWRRKRAALAQPIVKLTKNTAKLRSENVALAIYLESNQYYKLFIDCVTYNFTQNYGRPSTLEQYNPQPRQGSAIFFSDFSNKFFSFFSIFFIFLS